MNKEFVEIINRLRAILQDSWINELPDNEKIAVNFNKSELKLILNCISKERPAPVRIDRGLFGYDIVCSHCSSMLKKLPIYDKKDFLAVLEDSSYYLGKHCRYCGQALDLSPVEKFKLVYLYIIYMYFVIYYPWRKRNKRKNFKNHQKRDDLFEKHKL